MKHFLTISLILLSQIGSFAQFKWGIKAGVSTSDLKSSDLIIVDPTVQDSFRLGIDKANIGFHFGVLTQIKFGVFIIQPECLFNSSSIDYNLSHINSTIVSSVLNETYKDLDIPILFGFSAGPVRLIAGPVGHIHLNSTSSLTDWNGYKQDFKDITYGWQAGVGIDFFRTVLLDIRYEGNFTKHGDHITFLGNKYPFSKTPARLLASIAVVF